MSDSYEARFERIKTELVGLASHQAAMEHNLPNDPSAENLCRFRDRAYQLTKAYADRLVFESRTVRNGLGTFGMSRRRDSVDTRLEYLLYRLAREDPEILKEAENWHPGMLTNDMAAGDRARDLASEFAQGQIESMLGRGGRTCAACGANLYVNTGGEVEPVCFECGRVNHVPR